MKRYWLIYDGTGSVEGGTIYILLTFIYMVCVYPVNVYKYKGVNGTTKTGHRQLSMKQ